MGIVGFVGAELKGGGILRRNRSFVVKGGHMTEIVFGSGELNVRYERACRRNSALALVHETITKEGGATKL
jgi:hypothetical protein